MSQRKLNINEKRVPGKPDFAYLSLTRKSSRVKLEAAETPLNGAANENGGEGGLNATRTPGD